MSTDVRKMIVRAAKEDAEEIFNLHTETIEKISSASYPPEIIAIWQNERSIEGLIPFIVNDNFYIYKDKNNIKGFIHFTEDEIVGLYVRYSDIRKGVGKLLFLFAVESITKRPIKIRSTINAVNFYEKNGMHKA